MGSVQRVPLLGPILVRRRRTPRPRLRAAAALLASLALNAVALHLVAASGAFELGRRPPSAPVALAPVTAREWSANRAVRPVSPEPEPRGKVVELAPEQRAADDAPAGARFLSDRNTRVERETVSRDAGRHPRLAPRAEPGAARPAAGAPAGAAPGAARGGRASARDARSRRGESLALLGSDPQAELRRREGGPGPGAGAPPRATPGPALSLDREALARIAGGPGMDGFRDVEEGDETWLRSREFRFATFLNQMRGEIGDEWYPRVRAAIDARDPHGESFFYKERTVVLGIALAPSGEVKALSVLQSSTIPFLDEIAMASVREAQPFPNAPRAMFEDGPEVRVPFSFTVYPASGGGAVRWRAPVRP